MKKLLIADSSRPATIASAAVGLIKYPDTYDLTFKDTKNMTAAAINTWISTLTAADYDAIIAGVGYTRIEEVLGTATITVTEGAANEVGFVTVDNGVTVVPIGSVTAATTGSYADAIALTASINASGSGYTAARTDDVITISAPTGTGVAANAYALGVDVTHGGTLDLVFTGSDFADLATGVTAVGVLGDFTEEDFVDLVPKMGTGTEVTSGTGTAGAAATITLAAGSSAVDDYYNDMTIVTTGGTGANQVRRISDYDGTTLVATVASWTTQPDNTTTYEIYDTLMSFNADVGGVTSYVYAWNTLFPNNPLPVMLGLYDSGKVEATGTADAGTNNGTASSGGATTLVDTGIGWTIDAYIGYYVEITSGLGIGQVRLITGNTTDTLTVATWTTNPDSTSVYQIYKNTELTDAGAGLTIDANIDMYIGIVSGTGAGQIRKITDNTATVVTVDTAWVTQPFSDSVWQITRGEDYMFNNLYMQYAIKSKMDDFDVDDVLQRWYKVLDRSMVAGNTDNKKYQPLSTRPSGSPSFQDLDYVNELREDGKVIYEYNL